MQVLALPINMRNRKLIVPVKVLKYSASVGEIENQALAVLFIYCSVQWPVL